MPEIREVMPGKNSATMARERPTPETLLRVLPPLFRDLRKYAVSLVYDRQSFQDVALTKTQNFLMSLDWDRGDRARPEFMRMIALTDA